MKQCENKENKFPESVACRYKQPTVTHAGFAKQSETPKPQNPKTPMQMRMHNAILHRRDELAVVSVPRLQRIEIRERKVGGGVRVRIRRTARQINRVNVIGDHFVGRNDATERVEFVLVVPRAGRVGGWGVGVKTKQNAQTRPRGEGKKQICRRNEDEEE